MTEDLALIFTTDFFTPVVDDPYTYGAGAWYNPATGVYGRASYYYGPYGGVGRGAAELRRRLGLVRQRRQVVDELDHAGAGEIAHGVELARRAGLPARDDRLWSRLLDLGLYDTRGDHQNRELNEERALAIVAKIPLIVAGYHRARQGLEIALERYGFLERLRKKGFDDLTVELELDTPAGQMARIRTPGPDPVSLVEIRVRRDAPGRVLPNVPFTGTVIGRRAGGAGPTAACGARRRRRRSRRA